MKSWRQERNRLFWGDAESVFVNLVKRHLVPSVVASLIFLNYTVGFSQWDEKDGETRYEK